VRDKRSARTSCSTFSDTLFFDRDAPCRFPSRPVDCSFCVAFYSYDIIVPEQMNQSLIS